MRKFQLHIAWIIGRRLEGERGLIPFRPRIGNMKAAAPGQAKLDKSQGSVASVLELIGCVDVNDGIWSRAKFDAQFLPDDVVARSERRRARRGPGCSGD